MTIGGKAFCMAYAMVGVLFVILSYTSIYLVIFIITILILLFRLRTLDPNDNRGQGILHGLRYGGDSIGPGYVPKYRRTAQQVRLYRHTASQGRRSSLLRK